MFVCLIFGLWSRFLLYSPDEPWTQHFLACTPESVPPHFFKFFLTKDLIWKCTWPKFHVIVKQMHWGENLCKHLIFLLNAFIYFPIPRFPTCYCFLIPFQQCVLLMTVISVQSYTTIFDKEILIGHVCHHLIQWESTFCHYLFCFYLKQGNLELQVIFPAVFLIKIFLFSLSVSVYVQVNTMCVQEPRKVKIKCLVPSSWNWGGCKPPLWVLGSELSL